MKVLFISACALLLVLSLALGCGTSTATTTRTVTATGPTQTLTGPGTTMTVTGPVVTLTSTLGTNPFPGGAGVIFIGGGTYIGTNGQTSVLRPTGSRTNHATVTVSFGTFLETTVLSANAPVIPHAATVQGFYGFCFNCHLMPPGHTGRIANQDLCMDCHEQGPVVLQP